MVGQLLGLSGELGARFRLLTLLPGVLLAAFAWALFASGAPGDRPDLDRIADAIAGLTAWQGVLALLAIVAIGVLVEPLQLGLVRLLEGYWPRGLDGLASRRSHAHAQRRRDLSERSGLGDARAEVALGALLTRYPPLDVETLPTTLGNALRCAERRAGERYGFDTVATWPRLYPLVDDRLLEVLEDQRTQLDVAVRFVATFALAALLALVLLVWHDWWVLVALGVALLGVLAYRAAVEAALGYGETIAVAFDLHRFDLLEALHRPLPDDLAEEQEANRELSLRLARRMAPRGPYAHPAPEPEPEPQP